MTPQTALIYLETQAENIIEPRVRDFIVELLRSKLFQQGFGSENKHHAYPGGLVVHTAEVLEIARTTAIAQSLTINHDVLITASIFHDCQKVFDYDAEGKKTDFAHKIRHVAGSYAEWVAGSRRYGIDREFEDAVGHCILAHHGRKEWGSPIEPQTVEAHILHYADMLSCNFGLAKDAPKNE